MKYQNTGKGIKENKCLKNKVMSKECKKARNVVLSTIIVLTVIIIIISNI